MKKIQKKPRFFLTHPAQIAQHNPLNRILSPKTGLNPQNISQNTPKNQISQKLIPLPITVLDFNNWNFGFVSILDIQISNLQQSRKKLWLFKNKLDILCQLMFIVELQTKF